MNPTAAQDDPKYKSNISLDWEEVKDEYMFSISEFDAAMLAREVTLPTIEFLLEMMGNGDLPLLGACQRIYRVLW